jgi:hypothetical protein
MVLHIETPNLISLQHEGMKFTSFFLNPMFPSRAALNDRACYPLRVGIPWVVGPECPAWTSDKSFVGLNPNEKQSRKFLKIKITHSNVSVSASWSHYKHLPTHLASAYVIITPPAAPSPTQSPPSFHPPQHYYAFPSPPSPPYLAPLAPHSLTTPRHFSPAPQRDERRERL